MAGAGARRGRARRGAARHWLWWAGGGPCDGCEGTGATAGVIPKVDEASRGSSPARFSVRRDELADGAPLKRLRAQDVGPRSPENGARLAPAPAVPALLGRLPASLQLVPTVLSTPPILLAPRGDTLGERITPHTQYPPCSVTHRTHPFSELLGVTPLSGLPRSTPPRSVPHGAFPCVLLE